MTMHHRPGPIGLVLVDIDGTLVGPGNVVHPTSYPAIQAAQEQGVKVALCTGRPCSGLARSYAEQVALVDPHIFHSGAVVCRPAGEIIVATSMRPASYERLVQLARDNGESLEVYTAGECFVEKHSRWTKAHMELIGLDVEIRDLLTITEPIVRVQWVVPWENWPFFESETAADPDLQISVATQPDIPETCFSSVTAKGISKASAAASLAEFYGLTVAETAMIGDGDNDIDVTKAVGLGIAMGNSTPGLLAVADRTVANTWDGGLAEALDLALATRA